MLSPTLALRCSNCQHALALSDVRGASTCPACGEAHGLPPAAADALALYERAIQQALTDLVASEAAATPPAASPPPPPAASTPAPEASRPPAPVPATSPGPVDPHALLAMGPAPAPRSAPPVSSASSADPQPVSSDSSSGPQPVASASSADTLEAPIATRPVETAGEPALNPADVVQAPVTARPIDPAALSGPAAISGEIHDGPSFAGLSGEPAAVRHGATTLEFNPPGVPSVPRAPGEPVPSASPPVRIGPATLSGLTARDSITVPSQSSLLSIVYGRSTSSLAAAPLEVAAVREPASDQEPARSGSDLVAAIRSALPDRPDRPDAGPEPEGRIPATALAVARRTLLARHADERRRQQVREGNLAIFFAVVICVFLVVAGYWYAGVPIALIALVLRLRRDERAERLGAEVQRLADALGGQRLSGYEAIAAWFDSLWPAPVSPEAMWTSHMHGAVRCDVHGYSALVDVHLNEKTAGGVVYPPRITAYLAAIWPGRVPSLRPSATDLGPDAQARLTRLRKAGYTVVADAHGGLIMKVSEAIAQAARTDITRLPALQVPIGELADLARDLGAEPVPPP